MSDIGNAYFNGYLGHFPSLQGTKVAEYFRLHAAGSSVEAFELSREIDCETITDKKVRDLFKADSLLLAMKVGQNILAELEAAVIDDRDARCVLEYARYSYFFWNDHKKAWRSIAKLALIAPLSSHRLLILNLMFLVGHTAAIGGHRWFGYSLARISFKFAVGLRRRGKAPFVTNLIIASFPYTLFVTNRLNGLQDTLDLIMPMLPADSYYQSIFQASALYAHSYSGNITQSEMFASKFRKLHSNNKLMRYQPLSKLMPLLPIALRGYAQMIEHSFTSILEEHSSLSSDNLINAQFYRASALIALCLGRKTQARELVEKAIHFREISNSFRSWAAIDEQITQYAGSNSPFDPSASTFIKITSAPSSPQLVTVLMNVIAASSEGALDPGSFVTKVSKILSEHLDCSSVRIIKAGDALDELAPSLKFGESFIVFEKLPSHRIAIVWSMLNSIAPTIMTIEASVANTRDILGRLNKAERLSAIARMTQMLAHDVRKPFSILRMGLGMLSGANDGDKVKSILSRLVPEIDKAVSSVDGLIADVMEVGSTSAELIQEVASPESLIESTLGEICRVYPKASISIAYEFNHVHMSYVHVQKVSRVFSNIVGNAVQAMGQKGNIWFKTRERDGLIEFCVGNAGSLIPNESLPKLFDAFFTSGKMGGTGLGLAIAQKVVVAHGGTIWCESSQTADHPDGKVEFFFTLPLAIGHANATTANLPAHSAEITRAILNLHETAASTSLDKGELVLEDDIARVSSALGRPLHIMVIDDEAIYRKALAAYLSRTPEMSAAIRVAQACGSDEAVAYLANQAFDLIITDVDMGADSLNGFDLVTSLRQIKGLSSMICVHSNRIVAADHRTAIASGADAFLPKPMARAQLLRLVLQSAQKAEGDTSHLTASGVTGADQPEILVVDDNAFILEAWEETLNPDARVHLADCLEAFELLLAADPRLIDRLAFVITDLHFDNSTLNGVDVGKWIKQRRLNLPVLVSSDGWVSAEEMTGAIDRVIPKEALPYSRLKEFL